MDRTVKLTPEEHAAWEADVAAIEAERSEIDERLREARVAAAEPGFNGQLRLAIRSIHQRRMTMPQLLAAAGTDWETVGPFLRGQGVLSTDVVARLAEVLELELVAAEHST